MTAPLVMSKTLSNYNHKRLFCPSKLICVKKSTVLRMPNGHSGKVSFSCTAQCQFATFFHFQAGRIDSNITLNLSKLPTFNEQKGSNRATEKSCSSAGGGYETDSQKQSEDSNITSHCEIESALLMSSIRKSHPRCQVENLRGKIDARADLTKQ